jgi:hypothetical protein
MRKMAEDAADTTSIKAQHNDVPPAMSASEENVPSLPSEARKQEGLISSINKAISYTKQQAKAVPKKRMGEVLDEPAQRKSTDPVLQENLDAASSAGVKISAARSLLRKIAEEGSSPEATQVQKSRAEQLAAMLKAKSEEKKGEESSLPGTPVKGGY